MRSAHFISTKELGLFGFVPEGHFACLAGLFVAMNEQNLSTAPLISRTECIIVIDNNTISLTLVPSLGSIRFETSAPHPAPFFRMVLDVIAIVAVQLFGGIHHMPLLPHDSKSLLKFNQVILAAEQQRPLFIKAKKVHIETLIAHFLRWLPSTGKQDSYDVFISYR